MILGFLIVSSVLVVCLGRLGDMFGRVRMYNLGFVVYTAASLLLTLDPLHAQAGALWLIVGRLAQGVGAAFLIANSAAILTDAFPPNQRGLALGINNIAGISGVLHRLDSGWVPRPHRLAPGVPDLGAVRPVRHHLGLSEARGPGRPPSGPYRLAGEHHLRAGPDRLMIGITYGIEPYGGQSMGWTSPRVLTELGIGLVLLAAFCVIEANVANPMFRLPLFRIRAFAAGTSPASCRHRAGRADVHAHHLAPGIWLPEHGYSFASTPLWAGIYMIPLTARVPDRRTPIRISSRTVSAPARSPPAGCSAPPSPSS